MEVSCDLEVDVNGEEVFMVDRKILSSYCGRITRLFGKGKGATRNLKVIFHDFPGGAESFELVARFCYNNRKIVINPLNVTLLNCIAHFMEMNKSILGTDNLFEQTAKSLGEIRFWTWSELLVALKQCQELLPVASSSGTLDKVLDSLIGRVTIASETSPCPSTSSPDSSGIRLSSDTRSTESVKNSFFRATWWFDDLVAVGPCLIEIVIKSMMFRKIDHGIISQFLFYYQKSRLVTTKSDEKCKITEIVVKLLYSLDQTTVSCKSLFWVLRFALNLKLSKCYWSKLDSMIGSQLDQATLDNLLIPSRNGTSYLYDVNLVLRFVKSFVGRGTCHAPLIRLKKVASLMDLFITEVAPDPLLKPSKFLALVRSLPDIARDSYDEIYHAMDMYLEVHSGLSEEQKMGVCCGLNYEKLSSEACNHLTRNTKFSSKSAIQALMAQQCKLKSLLQDTNQPTPFIDSPCSSVDAETKGKKDDACEQIVLYAGKLDPSVENEKLKAHLQGMQWRVVELEKVCEKVQSQMTKIMKSRLASHSSARSLPRLCS